MKIRSYNDFLDFVKHKEIAILGMGVSNLPLVKILIESGAKITIRDKKELSELNSKFSEFSSQNVRLVCGKNYLEDLNEEIIFKSPGIPLHLVKSRLKDYQILTSEMEVFLKLCPSPVIAITGSDGKTTTSTLVNLLLKKYGKTTYLGGNIGNPLLSSVNKMGPGDIVILELSSFQLQSMNYCTPKVAIVTNITPNHLDYHLSFDEYILAKQNILKNQSIDDYLILNYDNEITQNYGEDSSANVLFFSTNSKNADCYLEKDKIKLNLKNTLIKSDEIIEILDTSRIKLHGIHNIQNYMAAILAVAVTLPNFRDSDPIREVAESFLGVEHRLEFVRDMNNIKFYNDSASSTPARTIAALNSIEKPIILIAGGRNKNLPFDELAVKINEKVKDLILVGESTEKIKTELEKIGYNKIHIAQNLEEAVNLSVQIARPGDNVLFSPSCTSFDMFDNAYHRGKAFKKLVQDIKT